MMACCLSLFWGWQRVWSHGREVGLASVGCRGEQGRASTGAGMAWVFKVHKPSVISVRENAG